MSVIFLRFSDRPILIQNWVYIFHCVRSDPYPDVLYSEEYQTKMLQVVCCEKFGFFSKPLTHCSYLFWNDQSK